MGKFKLKSDEFFKFLNESTYVGNINTGEITEFVNEDIEKLQKQVAAKLGYKLVDHRLELYGSKIKK